MKAPTRGRNEPLALRHGEERFRLLVESVRDYAIFMLDPEGRVISWNIGAERITGWAADDIVGRHFSVLHTDEARASRKPERELEAAAAEGMFEDEDWRVRKDGTRFWANVIVTAIRDRDGELVGYSKITRDLTERRRQEEALRQSEERFRLLVEGVQDYAIFMLDPDGRVVSWNAGARRLKGYEPSEIIGRHFSTFYPREAIDRGWPEHELRVATRDGRFEDEGWRLRKDGSRFWANVVITRLLDAEGRLIGFSKITRDLTERRRQEEALRQSEERFRLLVEGVQDYAIFMLDPDGHIASWNVGAQRIKGYAASEIIGQHFSRFYPREVAERGWPEHELAVARREGRFEDEGWRVRKDGGLFWASVVITAVRDAHGELLGFAKITRDLTVRRKVEALEEEGRRINEFLAMLGHELRNPLAPIRNAVGVLRAAGSTDATTTWARDVIDRQVQHLARIVDDLLDLGRINAGKITVNREVLDLRELVTGATDSIRGLFVGKRQRIEVHLGDAPVRVAADPTRMSQVILNLLTNAHKYTPVGGSVDVRVEVDGRFAQLRVCDDGIGIPPELLPRVFEPFVQGARTLDRAEGGLGIGLTLVRKLVELQGGTVSASSGGEGCGSEFVVRLPIAHEARPSASAGPAEAAPPRISRRVLVVDDNHDAADSLALLLELWGHEVRVAHDGPAALASARELQPELVLLDIGLPGMDGYQVAERMRGSGAVLVAMTGYGQPEDAQRARAAGCADHLVKPVDPERLERLVAGVAAREPRPRG